MAGERPALRGSIAEAAQESIALSLGVSGGYTTNAGPALEKAASPLIETSVALALARKTGFGQLTFEAALSGRRFDWAEDTDIQQHSLSATMASKVGENARLITNLDAERRVDVDENVAQTGIALSYETKHTAFSSFLTVSAAYLDYSDIGALFLEGGNQNDRDRLTTTGQVGIKYGLAEGLSLKAGVGVDLKRYTMPTDDFGLRRNSESTFPFIGLDYARKTTSFDLLYAPVYRVYRDASFEPVLVHTLTGRGELQPTPRTKLFTAVRFGIEESDFFIAQASREYVVTGGGMITGTDRSSLRLELSYTLRDFVGFERIDHKREVALKGRRPLYDNFLLTGEVRYLDYRTSFFNLKTDMVLAMVGVTYEFAK